MVGGGAGAVWKRMVLRQNEVWQCQACLGGSAPSLVARGVHSVHVEDSQNYTSVTMKIIQCLRHKCISGKRRDFLTLTTTSKLWTFEFSVSRGCRPQIVLFSSLLSLYSLHLAIYFPLNYTKIPSMAPSPEGWAMLAQS